MTAASSPMTAKARGTPPVPSCDAWARMGTAQSASRPGTPPDNAAAEPFFETPKGESVEGGELWDEGRGQAGHLQVHRALLQ